MVQLKVSFSGSVIRIFQVRLSGLLREVLVGVGVPKIGELFAAVVTVNVAGSSSHNASGSVARNVMVSAPVQSRLGMVIVATRETILTVSCVFPEYVQVIWASVL